MLTWTRHGPVVAGSLNGKRVVAASRNINGRWTWSLTPDAALTATGPTQLTGEASSEQLVKQHATTAVIRAMAA